MSNIFLNSYQAGNNKSSIFLGGAGDLKKKPILN